MKQVCIQLKVSFLKGGCKNVQKWKNDSMIGKIEGIV
jgi:hypothetical protein